MLVGPVAGGLSRFVWDHLGRREGSITGSAEACERDGSRVLAEGRFCERDPGALLTGIKSGGVVRMFDFSFPIAEFNLYLRSPYSRKDLEPSEQ